MLAVTGAAVRGGSASPDWSDETVFIVAGGPSVLDQDLSVLRGRRVIAIKGMYLRLPFADVLYFADHFWWRGDGSKGRGNGAKVVAAGFSGEIITTSPGLARDPHHKRLTFRVRAESFSENPGSLFIHRTVVTAAVNEAWHCHAKCCVLLGVDGKTLGDRTHGYPDDNGRKLPDDWQEQQRKDFEHLTGATTRLGMPVFNASPVSVYDFWPRVKLEDFCP
jgi:hypothetical protein